MEQEINIYNANFEVNFPYKMRGVEFVKVNHFREDGDFNNKCIIIPKGKQPFHELILTNNDRRISYKSFRKDYKKSNAHYDNNTGKQHSFLVQNNKYICVIPHSIDKYQVYDVENDQWLTPPSPRFHINVTRSRNPWLANSGSRSILAGDDIIVYSYHRQILFYYIGGDFVTNPSLVGKYDHFKSYIFHGLLCVNYDCDYDYDYNYSCNSYNKEPSTKSANNTIEIGNCHESDDIILNKNYKFKIMLFGGSCTIRGLLHSFIELDIKLTVNLSTDGKKYINHFGSNEKGARCMKKIDSHLNVKETDVDGNKIVCDENAKRIFSQGVIAQSFGHDIMYNGKNEPIIVIIGGTWQGRAYHSPNETHRDIYLYNCVSKQLKAVKNVKS